jgi:hypothetical protein
MRGITGLVAVLVVCAATSCRRADSTEDSAAPQPQAQPAPQSLAMGGAKSVTTFFITSRGTGKGGDLGGLVGADAHCQMLAEAEGSGDHTWRAYLSTSAVNGTPAVNARDRIGKGPWYNSAGELIATNVEELHHDQVRINKELALTEKVGTVPGAGDTPNVHDILTGSRTDGTVFPSADDLTCRNWTASEGRAQVGHHDRRGLTEGMDSWNSVHASRGCSQPDLEATGGAGLFYCFAID